MRRSILTAAWLTTFVATSPAWSAGMEYPELGAVAAGRGGAAAARPHGGLGLVFNPAGMAWSHGLSVDGDGKLMWNQVGFTTTDAKLIENTASATTNNDELFYATPTNGAVIYGFGNIGPFENLAVGLGMVGPSATGKLNYDPQGATRYQKTNIDYFFAYYSLGVAARIGQAWGVGATFQLAQGTAKFTQAVRGSAGESVTTDIMSTVNVSSGMIPTGVVGLTFMPHPKWSFGLSYRPKISFAADGTLTSVFPSGLAAFSPKQSGDSATLHLAFPHVVRLGAQYTPTSAWLVELDVVGEFWAVFDAARVDPHDITVSVTGASAPLSEIVFPKQYEDAVSFRLGADYDLLPERLTLRAGYFYETSAIPTRTIAVDFPNWGRQAVSVGASVRLFGAQLHVAYAHHFITSQTVTDTIVDTVSVPPLGPTPQPVGNGRYTASSDMLVVGLSIELNKLSGSL